MTVAVVHRDTFEHHEHTEAACYLLEAQGGPWVLNPDTSAVLNEDGSEIVPVRDWAWAPSDVVVEMTQAQKDARDAAQAQAQAQALAASIKERISTVDGLDHVTRAAVASGLSVTVNIEALVFDDVTTVVADPADVKLLNICYIYDSDTDTFSVQAFEKTTGQYAALGPTEVVASDLGEWSVPANGTDLTPTS